MNIQGFFLERQLFLLLQLEPQRKCLNYKENNVSMLLQM